jgi:hypothetical protein
MSGILFVLLLGFGDAFPNQRLFVVIQFSAEPFDHGHLGDSNGLRNFPLSDICDSHLVSQVFIAHFSSPPT